MDRGLVTARIHQSPIRTPPHTHRYLVPASLIGGSLRDVRNPDQGPHLHHRTPIDKMARVPATPTGRPRLPRHPSGGKGDKELAWRDWGNGTSSGARAGRPRSRRPQEPTAGRRGQPARAPLLVPFPQSLHANSLSPFPPLGWRGSLGRPVGVAGTRAISSGVGSGNHAGTGPGEENRGRHRRGGERERDGR